MDGFDRSVSTTMFPTSVLGPIATAIFDVSGVHSTETAATLVRAFLTSRMDYCNAVFAGAPTVAIQQVVSSILNAAARVIAGT